MPNKIRVTLAAHMGDCLDPVNAARESYGKSSEWNDDGTMKEGDQRLLRMLARGMGQGEYDRAVDRVIDATTPEEAADVLWAFRHREPHLAPFGHNYARFRFQAPVFVMRQIVKHEYIRLSELSMRYTRDMPAYFIPDNWRAVAEDVKQGSGGNLGRVDSHELSALIHMDYAADGHDQDFMRVEMGLCPEQARMFLRLCHMTQGTISGSMDAFAKLVRLRLCPTAQEETREFARQIDRQLAATWKISWPILTEGIVR